MFSFFKKKKHNHPSLDVNIEKKFIINSSEGHPLLENTNKLLQEEKINTIINVAMVHTSLYYNKGKLLSVLIQSPTDKEKHIYIDTKKARNITTIPSTISNKKDIYVNGGLLLNLKESIRATVSSISDGFYTAIEKDTSCAEMLGQFVPLEIVDNNKRSSSVNDLLSNLGSDFYFLMPPSNVLLNRTADACYKLKDDMEEKGLIAAKLVKGKDHIVVQLAAEGVFFYSDNSSFFGESSNLLLIDVSKQQEIIDIQDITFVNGLGNIIFAQITLDGKAETFISEQIKGIRISKQDFDRFKPSIGDKVFLNADEKEIRILSVIKQYRTPFKEFPNTCPSCNSKVSVYKDSNKDKVYICNEKKCTGNIKDILRVMFELAKVNVSNDDLLTIAKEVISIEDNILKSIFEIKKSRLDEYLSGDVSFKIYDTIQSLKSASLSYYVKLLIFITTHKYVMVKSELGDKLAKEIDCIVNDYLHDFEDIVSIDTSHFNDTALPRNVVSLFFDKEGECRLPDFEVYDDILYLIENKIIMI